MSNQTIHIPSGQALQALQALQRLFESKFPAKLARQIAKAIAVLSANPDIVALNKTREKLILQYGKEIPGGWAVEPGTKNAVAFSGEYTPIAAEMAELSITPLPIAILNYAPDMTPSDMGALEPFWEEESQPTKEDQ